MCHITELISAVIDVPHAGARPASDLLLARARTNQETLVLKHWRVQFWIKSLVRLDGSSAS